MPREEQQSLTEHQLIRSESETLVRSTPREIVFHPARGKRVDPTMVHFQYYNSFNYSMLTKDQKRIRMTVGITSANPREGKSLVASNLAVSMALGYRRKTVLVDLNVDRPRVHEIFGTPVGPGLIESMQDGSIQLMHTPLDQLSVLTAGSARGRRMSADQTGTINLVGLEHLAAFGEVISTLEQQFDFVIVDMPAINTRNFPILFTNHLSGLIVVVDTTRTRNEDIDKMFRQVNERQVLGFVLNRVKDDNS